MDRKVIFDTVRAMLGRGFTDDEVAELDQAITDADGACLTPDTPSQPEDAGQPSRVGPDGLKLVREFEGCKLVAYPDPGSADGKPWTIGWGATGPGISKGVTWTQEQADARHEADMMKYAREVAMAIGEAPTSQLQFDALVSFHYNTGAIGRATLTRLHRAGLFGQAAAEFAKWNKNDGKVMPGLTRRRAAEAELYRRGS